MANAQRADHAVLPLSRFCLEPGAARPTCNGRGIVVFGADVWASDWLPMTPEQELHLLLARIEQVGRGIVLLHDTKAQTAQMLPAFLRELKRRGLPHRARGLARKTPRPKSDLKACSFLPQPAGNADR